MTEFKKLSNPQLLEQTKKLVSEERNLTARIIELLEEISRRKLIAEMGYSSLFVFCQKELGYSEDQAHARISAMRLASEVPEARQAIEEGKLSLTNLAQVQTFLRHEKKAGKPYSPDQKRELLVQMEGLSKRECERKLAAIAPDHARHEKVQAISESETRLTLILDSELLADLEKIRAIWGHQELSYSELIQKMAGIVLKKIDPEKPSPGPARVKDSSRTPGKASPQETAGPQETNSRNEAIQTQASSFLPSSRFTLSRHIPVQTRRLVWKRDQSRCTYQDPRSGRRCDSRFALEIDHVHPFAQGGTHAPENLRLRCRAHNQLHAVQTYGAAKMARFVS